MASSPLVTIRFAPGYVILVNLDFNYKCMVLIRNLRFNYKSMVSVSILYFNQSSVSNLISHSIDPYGRYNSDAPCVEILTILFDKVRIKFQFAKRSCVDSFLNIAEQTNVSSFPFLNSISPTISISRVSHTTFPQQNNLFSKKYTGVGFPAVAAIPTSFIGVINLEQPPPVFQG